MLKYMYERGSNERTKISASFLITLYLLNFNGTAQNVTKSNPFRQRSHGGGNCSDDGGAHEGEPVDRGAAEVDNHISRDDIFDYHHIKEGNIYFIITNIRSFIFHCLRPT